jgi:Protein of unknown function (DUF1329)
MKITVWGIVICTLLLALSVLSPAHAQIKFDASAYKSLADADSSQTVPVGTQITTGNWQKYRQFMPMSMIAAYGGQYGWKVSNGPQATIVVGPTIPFKLPNSVAKATEKYAGQAQLKKVPDGTYTLVGYGAGTPFPKPSGPNIAFEIMYNVWVGFVPARIRYFDPSDQIDRFRNHYVQMVDVMGWRLGHNSDDVYPENPPFGKGYLEGTRFFLMAPEQVKYTTQVALLPDDPEKLQEIYVFLPSLRRSLRLSSAARCSPILGSDFVQDDNSDGTWIQPPNFNITLLGEKKILAMMHGESPGFWNAKNWDSSNVPNWPSPAVGKWELRDEYIIDIAPLPKLGGYCYGHKVMFVDKETWNETWIDNYDAQGKYWKGEMIYLKPHPLNSGEMYVYRGTNSEAMVDFQNTHATTSRPTGEPMFDKDCKDECAEPEIYAFPGGLSRIMR